MPTGYTADVQNGKVTDFPTFALQCARAFGALVTMRDDPSDAAIPEEFTPSPYRRERLAEAAQALDLVEAWTPEDAEREAAAAYDDAVSRYRENMVTRREQRQRYEAMLVTVRGWIPPTDEHTGLKEFMEQQLVESIKFDCGYSPTRPLRLTGPAYHAKRLEECHRDVAYHVEEERKERERCASRTAWIRALRDSLHAQRLAKEAGA